MRRAVCLVSLLSVACGGRTYAGEGAMEEGEGDASGEESSSTGVADTTEDGSGLDVWDDGKCNDDLALAFELEGVEIDDETLDSQVDAPCTVRTVEVEGAVTTLGLECSGLDEGVLLQLRVELDPGYSLPLEPQDSIHFRWFADFLVEWSDRMFRIDDSDGEYLISGIQGTSVQFAFPDDTPVLPYAVTAVPSACPVAEEPWHCVENIMDLAFVIDGEQHLVAARQHAFVSPGTEIWVGRAEEHRDQAGCFTRGWYAVVVAQHGG